MIKNFPTKDFSSSVPASNSPAYLSEAQSFKTIAVGTGKQRWEGVATTALEIMRIARATWAFLNARGMHEPFNIVLPIHSTPEGVVSGVVKSSLGINVGGSDITFINFAAEPGDFFRCAGHSKCYQVEEVNGSVATFYPPLLKPVTSSEVITVTDVPFLVRRVSALQPMDAKRKSSAVVKFKWQEEI